MYGEHRNAKTRLDTMNLRVHRRVVDDHARVDSLAVWDVVAHPDDDMAPRAFEIGHISSRYATSVDKA